MSHDAQATSRPETFATIKIQPRDLRPFVIRRWSATAIAGRLSLADPTYGGGHWRARSRERLLHRAIGELRREALSRGIRSPVIEVSEPAALATAGFGIAAPAPLEGANRAVASGAQAVG
jgi:hypothetical protein